MSGPAAVLGAPLVDDTAPPCGRKGIDDVLVEHDHLPRMGTKE
jgi:hypothetical protein